MKQQSEFDIVVHGATGFTGRLIAEHLAQVSAQRGITFALSGRNINKLIAVRDELFDGSRLSLIEADADNPASIARMVARTNVVVDAAGPFQLYAEPVVAACAEAGVNYLNLCGRSRLDAHDDRSLRHRRQSEWCAHPLLLRFRFYTVRVRRSVSFNIICVSASARLRHAF